MFPNSRWQIYRGKCNLINVALWSWLEDECPSPAGSKALRGPSGGCMTPPSSFSWWLQVVLSWVMSALGWTRSQEDDEVLPPTPGRQDTTRVGLLWHSWRVTKSKATVMSSSELKLHASQKTSCISLDLNWFKMYLIKHFLKHRLKFITLRPGGVGGRNPGSRSLKKQLVHR